MQLAYDILKLLSDGKFHSGHLLAQQLKVARSTVWKAIDYLRQRGLQINAVTGKGYCLVDALELISKHEICSYLAPEIHSVFPKIDVLNVVTSTNDYLIQRLENNVDASSVCIALEQTHGKGRGGKAWISPLGANIYLSFNWRFFTKLHDLSGLSLILGMVVLDSLKQYFGYLPEGLGIKWPNDVWYRHEKLCGILIESFSKGGQSKDNIYTDTVIGIGLNIDMTKKLNNLCVTDLCSIYNERPSKNKLVSIILTQAALNLSRFARDGLQAFSSRWAQHDLLAGKLVHISTKQQQQAGIACGINERGELCIKIGDTLKAVRYGEVSVRPDY